jgi:type IV secretion system protein VirB10
MDETLKANTPNRIEDKAPKPKGVIPKNTQSLVIIGVAVMMILIMWLTGGGKKGATNPGTTLPAPPAATPPDSSQVQAFKRSIESREQNLLEGQSLQSPPAAGPLRTPYGPFSGAPMQGGVTGPGEVVSDAPGYASYRPQEPANQPQPDPLKAEQQKRQYLSLFASNVALTYRNGPEEQKLSASPLTALNPSSAVEPQAGSPPSLAEAQAQALRDAQALEAMGPPPQWPISPFTQQPSQGNQNSQPKGRRGSSFSETKEVKPDAATPGQFNSAAGKKYVLFEGTLIPTALMNRLNGSFSGPVNCLVTQDVYSHDRQHVLIPSGTKVLGESQKVTALGQERLAVFFHRLIMPDGYSVSLDQFKGLDQEGATALRDKVNNHYAKIFGASLAVGILGGVAEVGTGNIFTESALDRARVGFGVGMADAGEHILDRFLNILPTITIREGTRVNVYLSNDLLLPNYGDHTMPPDL